MGGKVATGVTVSVVFAFVVGFLRGYTWGIEYALNNVKNLRHKAECIGEDGCEWVHQSGSPLAGESIASFEHLSLLKPFTEVPWWLGNVPLLRDVKYDVAQPLRRSRC